METNGIIPINRQRINLNFNSKTCGIHFMQEQI